ncbi:MAG: helix-turn-helix domain-containing protein [Clostridia bacterium]|nr:helix-turn-helix domain-containing protein [Clostridia bacterium]
MEKFSERLKELRQEKGLTIEGLARETGLSKSAISRWELSQADVLSRYLVVLADYFGVTTDYLLGRED